MANKKMPNKPKDTQPFDGRTRGHVWDRPTVPAWSNVAGVRFAAPLPAASKGPIRAREARRQKGAAGY